MISTKKTIINRHHHESVLVPTDIGYCRQCCPYRLRWWRWFRIVCSGFLTCSCCASCDRVGKSDKSVQSLAPDYQRITDANLRACVESSGINWVDQLQILECPHNQISSLAGLEQFTSLRVLNVRNNVIQSIEELRSLTALNWLDVSYNRIQDASPLQSLQQLGSLYASHNELRSLDALTLPELNKLYVSHNQLHSFEFVNGMPALKHLTAENNSSVAGFPSAMPAGIKTYSI